MPTHTVMLPALSHVVAVESMQRLLGRGDRLPQQPAGLLAALAEVFAMPAAALPVAALLREADAHDAGHDPWLCADPAFVQVEPAGARLMACGALGLSMQEAEELARPLRPLLGDAGLLLETTLPDRWQLRLSQGRPLPHFATPESVLGTHLLQHMPSGQGGRYWRALFNEVQIVLHQHPLNHARVAQGLPPVNALWFWGGGTLPPRPQAALGGLVSADPLAVALATYARIRVYGDAVLLPAGADTFIDLGAIGPERVAEWLTGSVAALRRADAMQLMFLDGARWRVTRGQRWRFWRPAWRPQQGASSAAGNSGPGDGDLGP